MINDPVSYESIGQIMFKRVPINVDIFDKITERTMSNICFLRCLLIRFFEFHVVKLKFS